MPVNRDRTIYSEKTHAFVKAIAQVFFDGDVDAAWDRWFKEAEEDALITGNKIDPIDRATLFSSSNISKKEKRKGSSRK